MGVQFRGAFQAAEVSSFLPQNDLDPFRDFSPSAMLGPPGDTKKNNVPGKIPQYRKPLQNLKTYYAKKSKKINGFNLKKIRVRSAKTTVQNDLRAPPRLNPPMAFFASEDWERFSDRCVEGKPRDRTSSSKAGEVLQELHQVRVLHSCSFWCISGKKRQQNSQW